MGGTNGDPRKQMFASTGAGAQPQQVVLPPNNRLVSALLAHIPPGLLAALGMAPNVQMTALPNPGGGVALSPTAPAGSLPPALATPPAGGAPAGAINTATTATPTPTAPAGSPSMPMVAVSPVAAAVMAASEANSGSGGSAEVSIGHDTSADVGGSSGAGRG